MAAAAFPNMAERRRIAEALLPTVKAAADRVLDIRRSHFTVRRKDDASPVTEADLASQHMLLEALGRICPGLPVIGEEDGCLPATIPTGAAFALLDPLDGTREFCAGRDEFTINVAIVAEGFPVLGIVHAPVTGTSYLALGPGAAFVEQAGRRAALPLRLPASTRLIVAESRSHMDDLTLAAHRALGPHRRVPLGSALKFALIASGDVDLYVRLGATRSWDTAAGQALVEATGGMVVTPGGARLACSPANGLRNEAFVAARTPELAKRALAALHGLQAARS